MSAVRVLFLPCFSARCFIHCLLLRVLICLFASVFTPSLKHTRGNIWIQIPSYFRLVARAESAPSAAAAAANCHPGRPGRDKQRVTSDAGTEISSSNDARRAVTRHTSVGFCLGASSPRPLSHLLRWENRRAAAAAASISFGEILFVAPLPYAKRLLIASCGGARERCFRLLPTRFHSQSCFLPARDRSSSTDCSSRRSCSSRAGVVDFVKTGKRNPSHTLHTGTELSKHCGFTSRGTADGSSSSSSTQTAALAQIDPA